MGHPFGWLTEGQNKTLNWSRQGLTETGTTILVEQQYPGTLGNHSRQRPLAGRKPPESILVIRFLEDVHTHLPEKAFTWAGKV